MYLNSQSKKKKKKSPMKLEPFFHPASIFCYTGNISLKEKFPWMQVLFFCMDPQFIGVIYGWGQSAGQSCKMEKKGENFRWSRVVQDWHSCFQNPLEVGELRAAMFSWHLIDCSSRQCFPFLKHFALCLRNVRKKTPKKKHQVLGLET